MKLTLAPLLILVMILTLGVNSGCAVFGGGTLYTHTLAVARKDRSAPISIVQDSPEVQDLVAEEEARQAEFDQLLRTNRPSDKEYIRRVREQDNDPARKAFFGALASAPHITVKENTDCRLLQISKARCSVAHSTTTFLKVVITNGPRKGEKAWICQNPYFFP